MTAEGADLFAIDEKLSILDRESRKPKGKAVIMKEYDDMVKEQEMKDANPENLNRPHIFTKRY